MAEKEYQPREYKTLASAKRAGKRECMRRGITAFWVHRLWANILVVGGDERAQWEAYVKEYEIPIRDKDSDLFFVWDAKKEPGEAQQHRETWGCPICDAEWPWFRLTCACGYPRPK